MTVSELPKSVMPAWLGIYLHKMPCRLHYPGYGGMALCGQIPCYEQASARGLPIGSACQFIRSQQRLCGLSWIQLRDALKRNTQKTTFCKNISQIRCMAASADVVPKFDDAKAEDATRSKFVLVVGATGGVGQLVVASLLNRGLRVRALLRDAEKARSLFGDKLEVITGDTRRPQDLSSSIFEGITHVVCCTGTTAFPSKRWAGDNTPEQTDWIGVRNLVAAVPKTVQRFVLVSSVGVTKYDQLPWNIMNLFGVLKYKKMGEDFLQNSGIPYTIIRPGRLTDGPYTSYDLNTLLKATAGTRRAAILGQGDQLVGEASRIMVAEACIQAMDLECTAGQTYELNSIEGEGPGDDCDSWAQMFVNAHNTSAVK